MAPERGTYRAVTGRIRAVGPGRPADAQMLLRVRHEESVEALAGTRSLLACLGTHVVGVIVHVESRSFFILL